MINLKINLQQLQMLQGQVVPSGLWDNNFQNKALWHNTRAVEMQIPEQIWHINLYFMFTMLKKEN